jgi:tripartite motif-containing protein 71
MTRTGRRFTVAVGFLSILGAGSWTGAAVPASAATTAPTYVRTIGHPGEAETNPGGIDVDAAGNVYVTNTGNDTIAKYVPGSQANTWTLSWTRGTRGAALAQGNFEDPRDIAVDDNAIYVADTGHAFMQILQPDGTFMSKWAYPFRSPIGVSVGSDGSGLSGPGHERILVSNGGSGAVDVFDGSRNHLFAIPPRLGSNAGSRDAATDPRNGDIYVDDYRHDMIQKYDKNGTWLLSWGGAGALACQKVPGPYGVDVADDGTVYVASSDSNALRSFTPTGGCIRRYGTSGTAVDQFSQLRRLAVSPGPSPLIFGADLWGIKVLVFNEAGTLVDRIGSWPKPAAGGFNEVHDVAVSSSYAFAPDTTNHRAQRLDLDGTNPIAWGAKGVSIGAADFNWPQGVGYDPTTNHVWIVDTRNSDLKEFDANGTGPLSTRGRLGSQPGQFHWPLRMTFDPSGNAYVADSSNNRIQSFGPTWAVRWTYGTVGSGLSNLRLPSGISFGGDRVYIADAANSRIVVLNASTGQRITILPIPKGGLAGQVSRPGGVAPQLNATGDVVALWVADTNNNRIEKFNPDGSFANEMLGGPGFGSTDALFNRPDDLAFGPDGLLYVADTNNDRIQVFQP